MATHSSTLAYKIPWMEEPGGLHTVHGVAKSRTGLSDFVHFVTESDSKHFLLLLRLLILIPCHPTPSTPPKSKS